VQRETHSQAAGRGESLFGAAGADEAGRGAGEEGLFFEREAEGLGIAARLLEPAQHLGAFAGLRGHEDRAAVERQRCAELFGERQGNRVDAKTPVERLDGAADGVRAAHAEQQELAGALQAGGGLFGHLAIVVEGGKRIGMLPGHFPVDRLKAFRSCRRVHRHPFTPPLVRPEIRARCMMRPTSTGGSAASTPAVAISP
jgi:hypothetical protein